MHSRRLCASSVARLVIVVTVSTVDESSAGERAPESAVDIQHRGANAGKIRTGEPSCHRDVVAGRRGTELETRVGRVGGSCIGHPPGHAAERRIALAGLRLARAVGVALKTDLILGCSRLARGDTRNAVHSRSPSQRRADGRRYAGGARQPGGVRAVAVGTFRVAA